MASPPEDRIPLGPILGEAGDVALRGSDGEGVSLPPNLVGNPRAALAFYVACGLQFQPHPHGANPYFALDQEELEMQSAARERAAA